LEKKLAVLEGSEAAVVTASGMAAVSIAVMITAKSGDHILVDNDLFVISRLFFEQDCASMGIEVSFVDVRDMENVRNAVRPNTKALFAEMVTNPNMYVADVPTLRSVADEHHLALIVDNTFLGPYLCRPLEMRADIVIHSATKYLSGHGDTIGGVLAGSQALMEKARLKLDSYGQCLSPMNAWLLLRGIRTLPLRMCQHSANGLTLARFLHAHEKVEWVRYPGLESHPQHDLAHTLLKNGFGGMLAFKVRGGRQEMVQFADALKLCHIAVSLGDLYTLVYPKPQQGNLIRVSVGCEHIEDIVADFAQSLELT
jgi:methionine-gamma-lyase